MPAPPARPSDTCTIPDDVTDRLLYALAADVAAAHQPGPHGTCPNPQCHRPAGPLRTVAQRLSRRCCRPPSTGLRAADTTPAGTRPRPGGASASRSGQQVRRRTNDGSGDRIRPGSGTAAGRPPVRGLPAPTGGGICPEPPVPRRRPFRSRPKKATAACPLTPGSSRGSESAMSTRALPGIAAAFIVIVLLCSGLAGTLTFGLGGGNTANLSCLNTPGSASANNSSASAPPAGVGPIGRWNAEQVANAATIIAVGRDLRVPPRGWVIAVATAMQESSLINAAGGDHDSIGLFQQRPSQGWGSPAQLRNPQHAAGSFYQKLLTVDGWQSMALTEAAQQVQRSAYPGAYAKWESDATHLVGVLTGTTAGPGGCASVVSAQGWTQPVHGTVGSGFRTPDRPAHDGVDLIVGKGTPIHAASTGTVSRVRCNAIDTRTGGDWGCDRDGDPNLTAGCGWYVDIEHPGGIVTRYCHQLVRPYVHVGQQIRAGDVIGLSGSSGHSSGPHVHFEVRRGNHRSATAVDPVPFMASVGAPLNR